MKILYIITSSGAGGAEKNFYHTVSFFAQSGEVEVISLKKTGYYGNLLKNKGIKISSFNWPEKAGVLTVFLFPAALTRLFFKLIVTRYDIVHSYLFSANIVSRIAAYVSRVPLKISSVRVKEERGNFHNKLDLLTSRLSDYIISVSGGLTEYLIELGFDKKKIVTVENSIDSGDEKKMLHKAEARAKLNIPDSGFIIGTIGRLDEQKNHIFLVEELKNIIKMPLPQPVKLIIIGNGLEYDNLTRFINENGLNENARVITNINEAYKYIKAFDLFILSSRREGLSNAVLEAMLAKVPVIAPCLPEMREVLIDGETCLTFSFSDKDKFYDSIKKIAEDADYKRRITENAYNRIIKDYPFEKNFNKIESLYKKAEQ